MHCNGPSWWSEIKKYEGSQKDSRQNLIKTRYLAQKRLATTESRYASTSLYDCTFKMRVCTRVKLHKTNITSVHFPYTRFGWTTVNCSAPAAVTNPPEPKLRPSANPCSGNHPDWPCVNLTRYPSTTISHSTDEERSSNVVVKQSFHAFGTNH